MGIIPGLLMSSLAVKTPTILVIPLNYPTLNLARVLPSKVISLVILQVGLLAALAILMVMALKTY
jgi:hypothetical protein